MPCAVDYILEGIADNLELERELGNFALDFDRDFLARLTKARAKASAETPAETAVDTAKKFDFVFLHDAAVEGPAVEMMANVVKAIRQTPETAPIVYDGEKPAAKIYVVLGAKALAKWYGGVTLANGAWFRDADSEVFYTWSPADIFRFGTTLTPAMKRRKLDMWNGLKEGMGKLDVK